MLVSIEWLNEYVDLNGQSPKDIAHLLTQLGHEVEKCETILPLPSDILVGEILEAKKHPKADTLQVCIVGIAQEQNLSIVCGAKNARKGLKVAVATIGTELSGNFKIKESKIRGELSEGMLCSEKELGLSEENAGIMELQNSWKVGEALASYVDLADSVLELSITPNRADCLSYLGLARDLAAKLGLPLKQTKAASFVHSRKTKEYLRIKIDADVGCARFTGLHIAGLKPISSPGWMQKRLKSSGMRPINLIVDVTNYVLLETGQPIHAYDERFLEEGLLQVRSATLNDKLQTLDGSQAKLEPGDLLVCDGKKSVALAGIMGGANSEVREDTANIIVEVAHFDARQIRRTAKRLGLNTEASHRFERGIDVNNIPKVSLRVADLLNQCMLEQGYEGIQVAEILDQCPHARKLARIALRLSRVKTLLNLPYLSIETCVKHLEGLQIQLIDKIKDRMLFEIPSFRQDIVREVDLIEEIARLEGFDKIPYELPKMDITPNPEHPIIAFADNLKVCLAQAGLSETISFPFRNLQDYEKLHMNHKHPFWPSLEIANPLNEEMGFLQTSLVPGLLSALAHNRHYGQKGSQLFEIGRVYFEHDLQSKLAETSLFKDWARPELHLTPKAQEEESRCIERTLVAGICDIQGMNQEWNKKDLPDFFHGKLIIEKLFKAFSNVELCWEKIDHDEVPYLHPGAAAKISCGALNFGYLGELHPRVALNWGFGESIPLVFELDLEAIFEACHAQVSVDPNARKFPAIIRDFAFVVDEQISFQELKQAFESFPNKKLAQGMHLFDLYKGSHIPTGKKSMAASFIFESMEKTLTDKEVEKESNAMLKWLQKEIGAELR